MRSHMITFWLILWSVIASGCTTAGTTNTARSSTEQLLISNAVDQSLDKIDFSPFAERTVYVDEKYVDCTDKNYVVSSVRHRIARAGGLLVATPDEARILVELRSGAVGTETSESFLGVPEIVLPGMLTLPEIQLVNRTEQHGMAKIGMVAIDAQTRQALGDGGMTTAQSDSSNWFVMGLGPIKRGTLRKELSQSLAMQPSPGVSSMPHHVAFRNPAFPADADSEVRLTSQETAAELPVEPQPNVEPRRLQQ